MTMREMWVRSRDGLEWNNLRHLGKNFFRFARAWKRLTARRAAGARGIDLTTDGAEARRLQAFIVHTRAVNHRRIPEKSWAFDAKKPSDLLRNEKRQAIRTEVLSWPWTGVEIECLVPEGLEFVTNRLVGCPKVEVGSDGSLRPPPGARGAEIRYFFRYAPPDCWKGLRKICNILSECGAAVNSSCGLHVHLNAFTAGLTKEKIARRLIATLDWLPYLMPESRRRNTYCRNNKQMRSRGDRYRMVNRQSFYCKGTIEIRLHSGTLDFYKIKNWIELLWVIARSKHQVDRMHKFMQLPVSIDLKTYVLNRAQKFSPELFTGRDVSVNPGILETVADFQAALATYLQISGQDQSKRTAV